MSAARGGVSRVITKLNDAIVAGDYYQAHQLYRTIYFRYSSASRFPELVDLLYDGGCKLLEKGQMSSGADLSSLFLDVLMKSKVNANDDAVLEKIRQLFSRMCPRDRSISKNNDAEIVEPGQQEYIDRNAFIQLAVKWSKQVAPEFKYGHPSLHQQFAHVFWGEKNYYNARYHFMLSHDGEGCASFLVEYHICKGYPSEVDLFIAQAVLQYLCHRQQHVASSTFDHYTAKHPDIKTSFNRRPPYALPLLNFIYFLLYAIQSLDTTPQQQTLKQFTILVSHYQPSIARDPCYHEYLDRIGQIWFGVPPPRPSNAAGAPGGFFANLLQSFIGGDDSSRMVGDDDDDADEFASMSGDDPPPTAQTNTRIGGESRVIKEDELE